MLSFKKPQVFLWLSLVFLLALTVASLGQMSGTSYKIPTDVMDAGGASQSSALYKIKDAIGQPTPIGTSQSMSYGIAAGYVYTALGVYRGNVNGDCIIQLGDLVYLISFLYKGGPPPDPVEAGDCNCNGEVNIGDVVYLISYLYKGGPPPSCTDDSRSSLVLGESLNKVAKPATVGLGQVTKAQDGLFEIPLEGKVDMEVAGLQFDIGYDPNFVTLLDPALTSRTEGLQVFSNAKDGTQRIGIVDLSGQNYVPAGEGPLIVLRGRGTDPSSIKIKEAILVDKDANKIPVEIVSEMKKGEEDSDVKEYLVPKDFSLSQNLPNPFNPETEISYDLPNACHVKLSLYNLLGQRIRTLVDEFQATGHKAVHWDGRDDRGNQVASGIYFYQIQAGEFTDAKKMILMK